MNSIDKTKILRYFLVFLVGPVFSLVAFIFIFFFLFSEGVFLISTQPKFTEWVYPAAIPLVFYSGVLFVVWRTRGKDFYPVLLSAIFAFIALVFVTNSFQSMPHSQVNPRNIRRAGDLRQLALTLEFYYENEGLYPIVADGCRDISVLEEFLVPTYSAGLPRERQEAGGHPPYKYAVSAEGTKYVLRATFGTLSPQFDTQLEDDLDGIVLGCRCDDPHYCLDSL